MTLGPGCSDCWYGFQTTIFVPKLTLFILSNFSCFCLLTFFKEFFQERFGSRWLTDKQGRTETTLSPSKLVLQSWLALKAPRKKCIWKCHLLKSAANSCQTVADELSIEANSMDPEQTAPIRAVWSGSTLFAIEASSTLQQMRKADDFCCDWRIKTGRRSCIWWNTK